MFFSRFGVFLSAKAQTVSSLDVPGPGPSLARGFGAAKRGRFSVLRAGTSRRAFRVALAVVVFLRFSFHFSLLHAQVTQPMVAIHDSELTRALESMPASGSTPTGPGTTGNQWWPTDWHYFVMPEAMKEAMRSDGTAFTVVGDSNIVAGALLGSGGLSKYPIVVSLASEAIRDDEIAAFTN